jgi:hypothetical protein
MLDSDRTPPASTSSSLVEGWTVEQIGKLRHMLPIDSTATALFEFDINPTPDLLPMPANVSLLLPTGAISVALFTQGEAHNLQTWFRVLQSRLLAARTAGADSAGNPCGPRIP